MPGKSPNCSKIAVSSNAGVSMLSQCIMKIPGVFVNIASGATRRPDVELRKETARRLCRVPPYAWPQTIHQLQTSMSTAELDSVHFLYPFKLIRFAYHFSKTFYWANVRLGRPSNNRPFAL